MWQILIYFATTIFVLISFYLLLYIIMGKLSIEERLNLLQEAENFFADLSSAWEENEKLWLRKAAALWTVRECLELYKDKALEWKERTEETLKEWLATAIEEDYIENMIKINWMTDEEASFYKGWFGMAVWIIEWDKETIDWLRELQEEYAHLEEMKASNRTIADLLK